MNHAKNLVRKKFLLLRKKKFSTKIKFPYHLIFKIIKKNFQNKKITIGCYYPSNYEVNILYFIKTAYRKNFKTALPVIKNKNSMSFKYWNDHEPLYVNKFGMLEPTTLH